jgi:hypothetical protein
MEEITTSTGFVALVLMNVLELMKSVPVMNKVPPRAWAFIIGIGGTALWDWAVGAGVTPTVFVQGAVAGLVAIGTYHMVSKEGA